MRKLIVLLLCAAVLGGLYLFDYVESTYYEYEMVDASSDVIVADGLSTVRFTARLTSGGQPVEGHTIYIYVSNGSLPSSRFVTDSNGEFTFRYYPYLYLNDDLTPLEDITIYMQDESNSVFFMVSAEAEFRYSVIKPEDEGIGEDWQDITTEEEG